MARKPEMLLLQPADELVFKGPFNRSVCQNILLTNPNKQVWVSFKMKTTSPRLFYVRPNIGIIGPGKSLNIEIYMQPMVQSEVKQKRHKFLIQAALATENIELQEFWKALKPEQIWDTRVKCELLSSKNNNDKEDDSETLREAGGLDTKISSREDSDCEAKDAEPAKVDKLKQKISVLEEERLYMKQELKTLRKAKDEPNTSAVGGAMVQLKRRKLFYWIATILSMICAIVGFILGKHYYM
ncbi:vesicle-associated membrane protein-associated protein A [Scaptodrosophila lebanonensis]|uniref:Vesicle-associated membrane protein-associated protein A n=1 Tax=Drosophila lebanonensis TaxID=7225 RepID=A0A6J2TE44_DROLE|nr:vesicle-associated membrane protein-associated protein A [Scaptodrosophila lebanonensis]